LICLLLRTHGLRLDKVERQLGDPSDGPVPEVGGELAPDLRRPRRRGKTRGPYGHDRPSTAPRVIRGSLGVVYAEGDVSVEVCGAVAPAPAGEGDRRVGRPDGAPAGPVGAGHDQGGPLWGLALRH